MARGNGGDAVDDLMVVEDTSALFAVRRAIESRLMELGLADDLTTGAQLIANELVTNALLHAGPPARVVLAVAPDGVRISVFDSSPTAPTLGRPTTASMTGRGLQLVASLAARLGSDPTPDGKVVWAELRAERLPDDTDAAALLEAWGDEEVEPTRHLIELGDVPTDLLVAAKAHVDNLVREFQLAATGAESGSTAAIPPEMAEMIETVVNRFSEARQSIKRQAIEAADRGEAVVHLRLNLGPDAAEAGEEYLRALDEADAYCRSADLLTLETPPRHLRFRHWYVSEIVTLVRRAEAGLPAQPVRPFEDEPRPPSPLPDR